LNPPEEADNPRVFHVTLGERAQSLLKVLKEYDSNISD
jgi:hypothetical protein